MSRQFDTTGGTDSITCAAGNAPPDQGPITVGVLAKSSSVAGYTGWMIEARKSGSAVWGFLTSNNAGPKLFAENDFGNGVSGLSTSWRWYVMTKASGSAAPRIHVWDLSGAWTHTDNSALVGDGTGAIDTIYVGSQNGSSNGWRGSLAVLAACDTAMNDAAVEAAFTLAALDTYTAISTSTKKWMVRLNQASTATALVDDTGGSGGQTAITGTSVDADDPPGYSYSLTPPSVNGDAAQTITLAGTVAGSVTRSIDAAQTATLAGTAAATVLRGQTVAQTATLAGVADAVVIHNALVAQTIGFTGLATPEPAAPAAPSTGNWNSLLSIYRQQAADTQRFLTTRITICPNHLYPLDPGRVPGTVHCTFGGELFDLYGNPVSI